MKFAPPGNPSLSPVNEFPCRLLIDPPASGAWNMAVDEALLNSTSEPDAAVLRFYHWESPTLSLGYFQAYADRKSHCTSLDIDVVRRQSGGGAIVHDRELTYSLVMPESHSLAPNSQALYDAVHGVIIEELQRFLPSNRGWIIEPSTQQLDDQRFLCFQRRSVGDILLKKTENSFAHKIVGSAQRKRRGRILQHGSILLEQSAAAPELPGIRELTGIRVESGELATKLSTRLLSRLSLFLLKSLGTHPFPRETDDLVSDKYLSQDWIKRR